MVEIRENSIEFEVNFPEAMEWGGGTAVLEIDSGLVAPNSASFGELESTTLILADVAIPGRWLVDLPEAEGMSESLQFVLDFPNDEDLSRYGGGIVIVEVIEGYRIGRTVDDIHIWPNPCYSQLSLSTSIPLEKVELQKTDGSVLRTLADPGEAVINLAGVDKGLLMLKGTGTNGQVLFKYFVHQ